METQSTCQVLGAGIDRVRFNVLQYMNYFVSKTNKLDSV